MIFAFLGRLAARLGSDCAGAAGTRGDAQCQDQCDASGYAHVSDGEGNTEGKEVEIRKSRDVYIERKKD